MSYRGTRRRLVRAARAASAVGACILLANCSSTPFGKLSKLDPKYGVSSSPRVVANGQAVPKGGGTYRVGKPYTVAGKMYVPEEDVNYRKEGIASWYGDAFHGRLTANGEVFDMASLTAAHPTLPIPSYARVTNLTNGKSLIVRVNDRGPFHGNRLIDVSNRAADLLAFKGNGVARVRVEYVGRASLEGSDDLQLIATLRTGEPAPSPSSVRVAAARDFVPEMPASRVARGNLPMPEGRPYSLGHAAADATPSRATTEVSATGRARSAVTVAAAPANYRTVAYQPRDEIGNLAAQAAALPAPRQVAARPNGRSPSEVLSGRGLY